MPGNANVLCGILLGLFVVGPTSGVTVGQEEATKPPRILLRSLERFVDFTVTKLDEDGLQLQLKDAGNPSRLVTWDEVQEVRLSSTDDQSRAATFVTEIGQPLFRLKSRLAAGDIAGLTQPAKALFPRFQTRKGPSARLVLQSSYLSHINNGEREAAITPYLLWLAQAPKAAMSPAPVPGQPEPTTNAETPGANPGSAGGLLLPSLLPMGFAPEAAKKALPELQAAIRQIPTPRQPANYLYFVSLAVAAGEIAEAKKVLGALEKEEPSWVGWKKLVSLQIRLAEAGNAENLAAVQKEMQGTTPLQRACFLWVVSQARLQRNDEAEKSQAIADLATLGLGLSSESAEPSAMALSLLADTLRTSGKVLEADTVLAALENRYPESSVVKRRRRLAASAGPQNATATP